MNKPIELKDNSPVELAQKEICKRIQDWIYESSANNTLVDLLSLPGREYVQRGAKPKIFQYWDNGVYAAGNYVGILEYHGKGEVQRVVIDPRSPGGSDGNQGKFLLRAMLEECWEIPMNVLELDTEHRSGEHYSQLLCARLCAQLDRAWKKGTLRFYRGLPRRDSNIKGRLDVAREIREGMGLSDGRMACEVREFTQDNDYNRLFLQACLAAERQHPNLMLHMSTLFPGYQTALQALRASSWRKPDAGVLLDRTRKKITNPIYREYEILRLIARAVLLRQGAETHTGGTAFVTGLLIDMSQLWERYLLKKILPGPEGRVYQAEGRILEENLLVYPDFLWENGRVVLDAKYKFRWGDTFKSRPWAGAPFHEDTYQVMSYMLGLTCVNGGVIFPVDESGFLKSCRLASMDALTPERLRLGAGEWKANSSDGVAFWRFPFAVPGESSDYSAFRQAMNREAERLSRQIKDLLFRDRRTNNGFQPAN